MRIREDSPFYGITEEQKELFLEEADELSYLRIAELWEMRTGKHTTEGQVKRFLSKLRYERAIRDTDDSPEDLGAFAQRAVDGKARDGLIEAARQKLFEEALANGNQALLLELYKAANEERAREREVAVAQRRAAVAEENAMIGWSKVPGGRPPMKRLTKAVVASSSVIDGGGERLLDAPKLRALLADGSKQPEERIAAALACLEGSGGKLLTDGSGGASVAGSANAENGTEEKVQKAPPPKIDWYAAPMKEAEAELARLMARERKDQE